MINLPKSDKSPVSPMDRPTVPMAEIASNIKTSNGAVSVSKRRNIETDNSTM